VSDADGYERFLGDLLRNTPEGWEASEGSAESIAVEYVHELERRVVALGGSLERHPEDEPVSAPVKVTPAQRRLLEALNADGDGYRRAAPHEGTYQAKLTQYSPYRNVTRVAAPLVAAGLIEIVPGRNGWRYGLRVTDAGRALVES
jgi:DNA-binding MarR family transcriptional regulator